MFSEIPDFSGTYKKDFCDHLFKHLQQVMARAQTGAKFKRELMDAMANGFPIGDNTLTGLCFPLQKMIVTDFSDNSEINADVREICKLSKIKIAMSSVGKKRDSCET